MTTKRILGILAIGAVMASCSSDAPDPTPVREETLKPNAEMRELVAAQNDAGFSMFRDLYTEAAAGKDADNLAYSPLSFSAIFSLVANGAEGETLSQMMKAINCEGMTRESVNSLYAEMTRNFSRIDPAVSVAFANSVWTDSKLAVDPAFRQAVEKYYESAIFSCDFSSLDAPRTINSWISTNTRGAIKEYFDPEQRLDNQSCLVNTLYFKAPWINKFDKGKTKLAYFNCLSGKEQMVNMMNNTLILDYAETEEMLATSLEMGGESDSPTFTFTMIMPKDASDFNGYLARFDAAKFTSLRQHMAKKEISLTMPRFSIESSAVIDNVLKKKGATLPFDHEKASFKVIEGQPWYVSGISQKIVFSADEEGATGAASTVVGGSTGISSPTPAVFNHPFIYVVTENATGAILFMGVITSF